MWKWLLHDFVAALLVVVTNPQTPWKIWQANETSKKKSFLQKARKTRSEITREHLTERFCFAFTIKSQSSGDEGNSKKRQKTLKQKINRLNDVFKSWAAKVETTARKKNFFFEGKKNRERRSSNRYFEILIMLKTEEGKKNLSSGGGKVDKKNVISHCEWNFTIRNLPTCNLPSIYVIYRKSRDFLTFPCHVFRVLWRVAFLSVEERKKRESTWMYVNRNDEARGIRKPEH